MSTPSLFNKDIPESYNDDARLLDLDIQNTVTGIAKQYETKGYSLREIEYAVQQAVFDAFLMLRLSKKNRKN